MEVKTDMNNQKMVEEFHKAFGGHVSEPFEKNTALRELRARLISEESIEAQDELIFEDGTLKGLAKELADVLYVVYGTAVTFDIPLDKVFKEVHESNMSKLGEDGKPLYRKDGKVLKGPNYTPPKLNW